MLPVIKNMTSVKFFLLDLNCWAHMVGICLLLYKLKILDFDVIRYHWGLYVPQLSNLLFEKKCLHSTCNSECFLRCLWGEFLFTITDINRETFLAKMKHSFPAPSCGILSTPWTISCLWPSSFNIHFFPFIHSLKIDPRAWASE